MAPRSSHRLSLRVVFVSIPLLVTALLELLAVVKYGGWFQPWVDAFQPPWEHRVMRWSVLGLVATGALGFAWSRGWLRARTPLLTAPHALLFAWAVGLAAGLLEATYEIGKIHIIGAPNWGVGYSADVIWLAPLVNTVMLVAIAAIVVLPVRLVWKGVPSGAWSLALIAFAACVVINAARLGLYPQAIPLLAAGIGVQGMRLVVRSRAATSRWVTRFCLAGTVAVVLLGATRPLKWRGTTSHAIAPAAGPSVLLLILDTVRAAELGLYGYTRPTTPFLDSLAQHAVVFDRAVSTASWTLPSHSGMFTGKYADELSADWDVPLDSKYPTLAEVFQAQGWQTGGFSGNTYYASARSGLARGFRTYLDAPVSLEMAVSNSWLAQWLMAKVTRPPRRVEPWGTLNRKSAAEVNSEFLDWLDGTGRGPVFAFLNYMDAHHPYTVPAPYDLRFSGHVPHTLLRWDNRYSQAELRELRDAYDNAVSYDDAMARSLFAALRARGRLRHTIVIIAADHGDQFAEKDPTGVGHGNSLYFSTLHVPLLVVLPSGKTARVPNTVSLRDLAATILDLASVPNAAIPGSSLRPLWEGTTQGAGSRSLALSALNLDHSFAKRIVQKGSRTHSIVQGRWHYIANGDGTEELYDVQSDPWERRDVSAVALLQDTALSLRETLTRTVASRGARLEAGLAGRGER